MANLNELELAEINILCLKGCIDKPDYMPICYKGCEKTLSKLMIEGKYDQVPLMEFISYESDDGRLPFHLISIILILALVTLSLFLVC
jgi:hypothetical protein